MSGVTPTNDPAVDEVREARRRISARFGHDPARLVRCYIELQEKYADRLVSSPMKLPVESRWA